MFLTDINWFSRAQKPTNHSQKPGKLIFRHWTYRYLL